jgi:capsular polysaccharide biosynthesis protein
MSQQTLDLRRSIQIVRRYRFLVSIGAVLGLLGGAAYFMLSPPPMFASTALVVLPQAAAESGAANTAAGGPGTSSYMATQVVVAGSDPVLSGALPRVSPAVSLETLRGEIRVNSLTDSILSINANGQTAAQAEATANDVARSYVAYVGSARSDVGRVPAAVLQPATSAARPTPVKRLLVDGLLGVLGGLLAAVILSLAIGRGDRRLRERDEIANSIGVPVLASFPVAHPADAAGWVKLFENYEPEVVHAWQLRRLLQLFAIAGITMGDGGEGDGCSLTVVSLSSDRRALALGPQLAVFAASQGIPTALVIGPQQDIDATATLRTACAAPAPASSKRPSQLRVAVHPGGDVLHGQPDAVLTVVVSVVDSRSPRVPEMMRTTATVLGVSAGAVTAEQLARVAVNVAANGREINGILVADPEPTDRTTGRIPQLARPVQRRLPTRLNGLGTETRR